MNDWRNDRIGTALRGENPTVLARLPASFAVIGDVQWLPGYCVLLTDNSGSNWSASRSDAAHAAAGDQDAVEQSYGRRLSRDPPVPAG